MDYRHCIHKQHPLTRYARWNPCFSILQIRLSSKSLSWTIDQKICPSTNCHFDPYLCSCSYAIQTPPSWNPRQQSH